METTIEKRIILTGKPHDLGGGMLIRRLLPQAPKRMVGPFTFFDHMGPIVAKPGQNMDVRPHPHIGLSTLTYLFEGRMVHRDSLGTTATIVPGEVNWMTAGKGISHSERAHDEDRGRERKMHGLQFWVALPDETEDCEPTFQHYPKSDIPSIDNESYRLTLAAGTGFGLESKVKTSSPLVLAHFSSKNSDGLLKVEFPKFEIGIYLVSGKISADGEELEPFQMAIYPPGSSIDIKFKPQSVFIVLGGEPFKSPRHIWWNLVSSSREKIEAAKLAWKEGRFPMVPGETESIPLPTP